MFVIVCRVFPPNHNHMNFISKTMYQSLEIKKLKLKLMNEQQNEQNYYYNGFSGY